ncbi:hypothetical protein EVAR_38814_1 [Eumeta japonica]|uniref:Uncharacterized protein n=1 Tax=Eumeta variegata TaxID=151549 RepID=A0A4C1XNG9_EUMVA|nr:hypothetical protein EVAR_38814_1 [Eumeta japonica]
MLVSKNIKEKEKLFAETVEEWMFTLGLNLAQSVRLAYLRCEKRYVLAGGEDGWKLWRSCGRRRGRDCCVRAARAQPARNQDGSSVRDFSHVFRMRLQKLFKLSVSFR